ncbi:hypothetical protein JTB14_017658 [Gonioctena quinquepunctata]|nr:hypothetical protein JTB14_017658 [Gonioctena quinquepunctata]
MSTELERRMTPPLNWHCTRIMTSSAYRSPTLKRRRAQNGQKTKVPIQASESTSAAKTIQKYISKNGSYTIFIYPPISRWKATGKSAQGDINAKSPLWGASHADNIGEYVTTLDLLVVNKGNKPTFEIGQSTFIDRVTAWEVLDEETFYFNENKIRERKHK